MKIWESEDPNNPSTWQWTSADRLFLKLIEEVHNRDMKIIIDGVFNHVGIPFWAFQDVMKHGKQSEFKSWFDIISFDDPSTPENEFDYHGWYGIKDLAELKENENGLILPIRNHIKAVVKRWMDPNQDGDPSDGIDGWRLDVAELVHKNFWKDFRKWVLEINPDAFLTGEVWWEDYNKNKMFNAEPWLRGDIFNSVMNYRFGDAAYRFFIDQNNQISTSKFNTLLHSVIKDYGINNVLHLQNMVDSHDTERLASAVLNPDRWIDHDGGTWNNWDFIIKKPSDDDRVIQKSIVTLQFIYPGAPFIYYGDEVGMWGGDDPDCRKPMVWPEFEYENETTHPCDRLDDCVGERPTDEVFFDQEMYNHYAKLISIRKSNPALIHGDFKTVYKNNRTKVIVFKRAYGNNQIIAMFNGSNKQVKLTHKLFPGKMENWQLIFGEDNKYLDGKKAKIFLAN